MRQVNNLAVLVTTLQLEGRAHVIKPCGKLAELTAPAGRSSSAGQRGVAALLGPLTSGLACKRSGGQRINSSLICRLPTVLQLICTATGETVAALLGPLTGGLVGEALRRHGCRLLPVAAPTTLLGHAAVVTYCLEQTPALLPLSPVGR